MALNIQQKLRIIERLENGEKACVLAQGYGIGSSTVIDIKKAKDKFEIFCLFSGMCLTNVKQKNHENMQ